MVILEEESLTRFKQRRRNSTTEDGEQTMHTQPNIDAHKDPSDIDVDHQEVCQSNKFDEKETTHEQLRR